MTPPFVRFFPLTLPSARRTIYPLGRWASGKAATLPGWLSKGSGVSAHGAFSLVSRSSRYLPY
jgi:hypothetical protein